MLEITAIERRMRHGRASFDIFIDGELAFGLSDLDLSMSGLRIGQQLTQAEVAAFQGEAKSSKAYGLALRYIGVRVRSAKELRDYLVRKGCADEEIVTATDRLKELGVVSDRVFAEAWVADRQALKPRSKRRLAQELGAKGVASDIVTDVLASFDSDAETEVLISLIQRKRRSASYADDQKLSAYFQRQGYGWAQIKEALARTNDEKFS
jgi:regulatory protein